MDLLRKEDHAGDARQAQANACADGDVVRLFCGWLSDLDRGLLLAPLDSCRRRAGSGSSGASTCDRGLVAGSGGRGGLPGRSGRRSGSTLVATTGLGRSGGRSLPTGRGERSVLHRSRYGGLAGFLLERWRSAPLETIPT